MRLAQSLCACAPVDARTFLAALADADRAIAGDDVQTHREVRDRVFAMAPCLTEVVPTGPWASFLVGEAAVRYLRGEDWESPLSSALQVAPTIDRGVGPTHEIALWEPPAAAPSDGPVPRGDELFVDGRRVDALPGTSGLHLVQRVHRGAVTTALVERAGVPPAWLTPRPAAEPVAAARIGLWLGAEGLDQRVTSPGTYAD
ncbi:MAG: hypothetical protein ABMA64_04555, partial [Myxococcota bacterium]